MENKISDLQAKNDKLQKKRNETISVMEKTLRKLVVWFKFVLF